MIKIIKTNNYEELSKRTAELIIQQIQKKSDSVLGLATGSSPIGTYRCLVESYNRGEVDFQYVRTVNLDEYKNIDRSNPASYCYFMHQHLFDYVNIKEKNIYIPNGLADDDDLECAFYEKIIDALGGIDLQLLGIGHNGHIGFNEPGDVFEKKTHVVNLSKSTIQANSRLFSNIDDVPKQAITMGIEKIMKAKKIIIIANGIQKAAIIKKAFWGEITPVVPASILQLHQDVTLIADEEALSEVDTRAY